jgi:hypothetical protein
MHRHMKQQIFSRDERTLVTTMTCVLFQLVQEQVTNSWAGHHSTTTTTTSSSSTTTTCRQQQQHDGTAQAPQAGKGPPEGCQDAGQATTGLFPTAAARTQVRACHTQVMTT